MGINIGKILKGVAKVGLPIAGLALGGPLGGLIGGGVGKAIGGIGKHADLIGAGLGLIGSAKDTAKARKLRDQATGYATKEYEAGAPLRGRARGLAMRPFAPRADLTSVYEDLGNPFYRPVRPPPGIPITDQGGGLPPPPDRLSGIGRVGPLPPRRPAYR